MPGRVRAVTIAIGLALIVGGAVFLLAWMRPIVSGRIRTAARQRGFAVSWQAMKMSFPTRASFDRLVVTRLAGGDTILTARSLEARVAFGSLLRAHPEIAGLRIEHATFQVGGRAADLPDSLIDEPAPKRRDDPARLARVRRSATALAQMLTRSSRALPGLGFEDVTVRPTPGADQLWGGVHIERLDHVPEGGGSKAVIAGTLLGEFPVPFHGTLKRTRDQRVRGQIDFTIPDRNGGAAPLRLALDAALVYDRAHRAVELRDNSRVRIGDIDLRLGGRVEEQGPHFTVRLAADDLSEQRVKASLPPATLGPLTGLALRGTWDYRLEADLDLDHPDSTRFRADVIPHGLALDPMRSTLRLTGLDQPFQARIHLPRDRIVVRDLSPANPHFRPLGSIASDLVLAVVTNEDGGFFRHRGFNTGAVQEAIGENLRSASFRRGAGTITMQIARNLWLGHERTLSRKGQEVVLAWVLEHLTGLPKERLLEIYLNIIEWGPGVHGADEAASFYFDTDAGHLSLEESLFLSTLVPSPARWRQRLDADGHVRPYVRAQMHFIGRAMVAKGWLSAEDLPPSEDLDVRIRGAAHQIVFPEGEPEMVAEPNWLRRLWTSVGRGR
jgi:hypothetical protein